MVEMQNISVPARVLPPPNRRRDKPQLSCNTCRSRKLKCDREHPCDACRRRGLSESCTYVTSNISSKSARRYGPASRSTRNVQDRIVQSEHLTTPLANGDSPKSAHSDIQRSERVPLPGIHDHEANRIGLDDPPPLLARFGCINLSCAETTYVGSSHWTAILDRIPDLDDTSQNDNQDSQDPTGLKIISYSGEPDILFGTYHSLNSHQVLGTIPPKEIADQLVGEYFSQGALASVITHNPTFLKQYEQFWAKPEDTPIIWVGLLFAVMCLASAYQQQQPNSDPESHRIIQKYRERISQCLVLGKYTKCPPFTVETLLILLHIEYIRYQEMQMESWVLLGTSVHLAFRAGYHRDPSNFPVISPFDGEMRRRAWASLVQFDTLLSTQLGIPGTIKDSLCDAAEPLNLLDEDLDQNMTAPPRPRPDTLHTPMQFLLAKTKIAKIYRDISELTESIKSPAYAEVMRLDSILNNIYSSIPDGLKMFPRNHSLMDTPDITMQRIEISILFQRARCVLHHKYVSGEKDNQYAYSRSTCIEGAFQILEYQQTLNLETRSNGKLYQERWKVSSFAKSCFYLAATLLCLVLEDDFGPAFESKIADSHLRWRIVQSLDSSLKIWDLERSSSIEARKIIKALETVLRRAQNTRLGGSVGESRVEDVAPTSTMEIGSQQVGLQPTQMSIHVLLGLNDSAGIDYSETNIPRRPSNLAPPEDDLSDITLGFPRMFGFANDGVRKVFGGARED